MRAISLIRSFLRARNGAVVTMFAFSLLPMALMVGASVDFSRSLITRDQMQVALDSAVLAGVAQPTDKRADTATKVFNANLQSNFGSAATSSFTTGEDGSFAGAATATVPTTIMQIMKMANVTVSVKSAVGPPPSPTACIVAEANGIPTGQSAITLNGTPNLNLAGCGAQSNASMTCNGHDSGSLASVAVGTVSGCSNPQSSAPPYKDNFKSLAVNLPATTCGGNVGSVNWVAGSSALPTGENFSQDATSGYTQYHVCGDLNLSGSGSLFPPGQGAVIVVENGSINVEPGAAVAVSLTTIVLTGDDSGNHYIKFPAGGGKGGSLAISPPTDLSNPWHGVSLYVDPSLTANLDDSFGPGASLTFDGVAYMPNTNLTFSGKSSSGAGACSQLVVNSVTIQGSAQIDFQQSASGCRALGFPAQYIPYLKV